MINKIKINVIPLTLFSFSLVITIIGIINAVVGNIASGAQELAFGIFLLVTGILVVIKR